LTPKAMEPSPGIWPPLSAKVFDHQLI
jgi:hypothetical protein